MCTNKLHWSQECDSKKKLVSAERDLKRKPYFNTLLAVFTLSGHLSFNECN